MKINLPEVVAELRSAFQRYEAALIANDVQVLIELFWDSPHTVRLGRAENLFGSVEISAFRSSRKGNGLKRHLYSTVITTFGEEVGTTSTLFQQPTAPNIIGRQMQTWIKIEGKWRIVAAHVSLIAEAPSHANQHSK